MSHIRSVTRPAIHSFLAGIIWLAATGLSGLAVPAAAKAGEAFVKQLKARNAHHFAKPLHLPKEAKPLEIERDWQEKLKRKSWTLSKGPLSIEVTLKQGGPPDGALYVAPLLSLSVGGKRVISVEGAESFPDNPVFLVQTAEMDKGNPYPEVVFSVYTGGAHCCSGTHVLTSSKDGKTWRDIKMGMFDGGPLGVSDLNGDGRFEFSMRDNAFLYAFGCYACSTAPFKVLALKDGKLADVSTATAFRDRQIDSLSRILEWAAPDMDVNAFLAGYVAQKILLGEGAQAWKFMLKHYDRKDDWGLDECSVKRNKKWECPKGKLVKRSYPDALEGLLKKNGYKLEK